MSRIFVSICIAIMALCVLLPAYAAFDFSPSEQAWIRAHVGMYLWEEHREGPGHSDYQVDELSILARKLGTTIGRTTIGGFGNAAPIDQTFLQTLQLPRYQTFIKSFDVVILTIGIPDPIWQPEWTKARYQEITEYLLKTYPNKTFILGNWEGDWWCPGSHTWDEAIALFQARHDGIVAGRAAVPDASSKVLEMIEMVQVDPDGKKFMINNLIPKMKADLYSLSTWAYNDDLPNILAYMKTKCPDSSGFGDDNVMIGEFGNSNNVAPEKRLEFYHKRIPELMTAKVPYVAIWELADTDAGLMDAKYNRGRKFAPYYLFWRAYHANDDRLMIDDFEIDPLGFPFGDVDEDGHPVNNLGGRRVQRRSTTRIIWQNDGPAGKSSRVLNTTGLSEELGSELDASHYEGIGFWAKGDTNNLTLMLNDAKQQKAMWQIESIDMTNVNYTPLPDLLPTGRFKAETPVGTNWQYIWIPKNALEQVDWSRLTNLSFYLSRSGSVLLDSIAFRRLDGQPESAIPSEKNPLQILQIRSSTEKLLPIGSEHLLRSLSLSSGDEPIEKPFLRDNKLDVKIADRLGALHTLTLCPGATGEVRLAPLHANFNPTQFPKIGLTMQNLVWDEQFRVLHAKVPDKRGYLEWRFSSPYPIKDFRFVLYGEDRPKLNVISGIAYSTNGKKWHECAITRGDSVWPHTQEGIVGTPPAGYKPSKKIWVRYWLKCASTDKDWFWHANITDINAQLILDTTGLKLPAKTLTYKDNNSSDEQLHGVLSIDE